MKSCCLILDSGAFSAWTKKVNIDIDEYADFCLANLDAIDHIVNLDVIPGAPGIRNTAKDIQNSVQKGWENYEHMLSRGIPKEKLIHIFHMDEDFEWLTRIADSMDYIGLSPANDRTTAQKIEWLDQCMEYICPGDGMPRVKFHGFAVTSIRIMKRFPWYSVDSTSWLMAAAMGFIYVPKIKNGEYIYDEEPYKIDMSTRSPGRVHDGKHFRTIPRAQQNMVREYIAELGYEFGESKMRVRALRDHLRKTEEFFGKIRQDKKKETEQVIIPGICNRYQIREEMNIKFLLKMQDALPSWPWPYKRQGIQKMF